MVLVGTGLMLAAWLRMPLPRGNAPLAQVPETVLSCVQGEKISDQIDRVELMSQAYFKDRQFYLFRLREAQPNQSFVFYRHIVSASPTECKIEFSKPIRESPPFSDILPIEVAKPLRLGELQRFFAHRKELSAQISAAVERGDSQTLPPEDIWALQHLGLKIPQ